jgi:uncharacterized protein (TIGR03437 family)
MSRIVIVFLSFLFLIPQGSRAAGTLTTVVMTNQTPDNACTQPPSVTSFSPTEQVAWLWFLVTNVAAGDDYSVAFYTPAGQDFSPMDTDFESGDTGTVCYAVGMPIAGYTPATMPGTWNAYIFNKGVQIYKEPFTIAGSTSTCTYSLSPSSASVAASGGSGSFSVTLGSGCTASVSSDSWITFTISGTTVNYTVQPNTGTSSRVGHITVGPQGSSVGAQTFTVTQAGASGGGGTTSSNLIQNGDAESGPAIPGTGAAPSIPGWNTDGNISVVAYTDPSGDLTPTSPGPPNRGNNCFAGGPNNASSKMTQTVDLSAYAAAIDAGTQAYTLDGWLGGLSTQNDNAAVTVTFENASGGSLGTATIGPVLSADRGGVSELVERSTSGTIPTGTRKMLVTVTFTRTDGAYNDGALDNLSFVLGSGGSTATGTSITITNPGFETIPSNPAWINCAGNGGPGTGGAGCQDTLNGIVPGWTASNTTSIGLFQPGPNLFTLPWPAAEGQTAAQVNSGTLSQVVSATLQVSTLYTLQVDVGRRLDNQYPSTPPTVQLFAGNTLIASATGAQPPLGGWTTWTGTYQSSASDPLAGQPLKIVLGAIAVQGDFDNVRLTASGAGGGTTGVSVYYRFENGTAGATATGSGSIVDSMGNQNGTPSGSAVYSSDVPLSTLGGVANKLSLNLATNGSVQFPGAFPLNTLTNATVEFYVKPTGTNSQMFFLWTRTDSTDANRFNMGVINGNSIGFDYREPNGTWHIIFPGGGPLQISNTGWSHVAVVKSGNVWTGYINGVQMGQPVTDANPNLPTNTGWTLNGSNLGQFAGLLDEFRISNSALTPSQFLPPVSGGATCTYSLSPSSASPGATQATGSITVTAGTGCAWTATSNATSWITITAGASGSGNGTVSYTVAANTGTTSRTGTITVGGQTFTVNQAAAAACSYSMTPSTNTMGAQGGSGSFVVTTGSTCSWSASVSSSASSWLHLGSSTSGTGGGTVGYSADVNTSTVSRTGIITVGGQTFTLTEAGGASATAPSINSGGIVNAVSNQGGGGIAQGSMFSIYGTNLGPTVPSTGWTAYQFPIPDTVNNVIVNVTAGSTTLRAYLLFVRADQINAIMPSGTPLGTVQVTVSYNGVVSAAAPVTIVKTAVGINSSAYGSGPGIIKNYNSDSNQPYNTASTPAKPNQVEIIVGTGLGAISTPDNQSPPGGAPTTPVQVVIGGIQAGVTYSGRAPGNAGQDQINFTVPSNVPLGCSVPLQVSAGGTWSNTVRIAISSDGSHCQDSFNPLAGLSTTGGKIGTLGLIRVNFSGQLDPTSTSSTTATLDLGFGTFTKTNPGTDFTYSPIANLPPPGTCASTSKANLDLSAVMGNASSLDPTIAAALDAGAQLTVTGGAGGATGTMTQELGVTGPYVGVFGGVMNVSGVTMPPPFLDGGPFTISGTGGADVKKFSATVALAPAITWTNPPSTINRSSPLTLNWTGGSSSQTVMILGGSSDQNSGASGGFLCIAPAGAHSFTVPVNSLVTLVPTGGATSSSGPVGFLSLMPMNFGSTQNFTAQGLDLGIIFDSTMTAQTVQVQ